MHAVRVTVVEFLVMMETVSAIVAGGGAGGVVAGARVAQDGVAVLARVLVPPRGGAADHGLSFHRCPPTAFPCPARTQLKTHR